MLRTKTKTPKHQSKAAKAPKVQKKKVVKQAKRNISLRNLKIQNPFVYRESEAVNLDVAHPDIPYLKLGAVAKPTKQYSVSKLDNGITIVSAPNDVPLNHIAVTIKTGSAFEPADRQGWTHYLGRGLLRTTPNRVTSTLIRDLNKVGAEVDIHADRDSFTITATTPTRVPVVLGAIADVLQNPLYDFQDLRVDLPHHKANIEAALNTHPEAALTEALFSAAFGNKNIGKPLYINNESFEKMSSPELVKHHKKMLFHPQNITIAAVGPDLHDELANCVNELFGAYKTAEEPLVEEVPEYIGGHVRVVPAAYDGPTIVSMAFPTGGYKQDGMKAHLIKAILGGGKQGQEQSALPVANKTSILNREIIQKDPSVYEIDAFASVFGQAGLVGIDATIEPGTINQFVTKINKIMADLQNVSEDDLKRGANIIKAEYQQACDLGASKAQVMAFNQTFLGTQTGPEVDAADFAKVVKAADVAAFVKKATSVKPTIATIGDVAGLKF
eukprot:UN01125